MNKHVFKLVIITILLGLGVAEKGEAQPLPFEKIEALVKQINKIQSLNSRKTIMLDNGIKIDSLSVTLIVNIKKMTIDFLQEFKINNKKVYLLQSDLPLANLGNCLGASDTYNTMSQLTVEKYDKSMDYCLPEKKKWRFYNEDGSILEELEQQGRLILLYNSPAQKNILQNSMNLLVKYAGEYSKALANNGHKRTNTITGNGKTQTEVEWAYNNKVKTATINKFMDDAGNLHVVIVSDMSPDIQFDVNQNSEIDENLDVSYAIYGKTNLCTQYLISASSRTLCGALKSKAQLLKNDNEYHFIIPPDEITNNKTAHLVMSFYNFEDGKSLYTPELGSDGFSFSNPEIFPLK